VEIKSKPQVIVGLSPTAVELVYSVGGTVAGRSSTADYPEAAKQAKEIGTAYQPSYETVLSLKPDLVVADSVIHAGSEYRPRLEDLGVPVIFAGAESYQQVLDGVTLMGKVLGAEAKASEVVASIVKSRDDARAAVAAKGKTTAVFLIAGRDNVLYAAKESSFAGDVLKQVGIDNLAAAQADSGPFPGYSTVAIEKLLEYNPDILFTTTPGPASVPRLNTLIPQIPPLKGLKAVQQNRVVEIDVKFMLEAPGPRIVEAFKAVSAAVTGTPSGS
jgi:iron complex transport system substrate-binding protein